MRGAIGGLLGGSGGTAIEPLGGTVIGGIEGWEEGYTIGSEIEDFIRLANAINQDQKNCNQFNNCRDQWIDDLGWCDNNTKGYRNVDCHQHAADKHHGEGGFGTEYELTRSGSSYHHAILYSFCRSKDCIDGANPAAPPSLDASNNLFGTTYNGGQGHGVVYETSQ
jgi:hypothetical protein